MPTITMFFIKFLHYQHQILSVSRLFCRPSVSFCRLTIIISTRSVFLGSVWTLDIILLLSLRNFATERIRRTQRNFLLVGFGSHQRSDGRRRLQASCGTARESHRTMVLRGVSIFPSRQRHRNVRLSA